MKLKELFDKYTFDEILPYLKAIEPERGDSMYQFREALDLLKHMEPSKEDCGDVQITWYKDEFDTEGYISVYDLEGVRWEAGLAKEVVVAEDLQLDEKTLLHIVFGQSHSGDLEMSLIQKTDGRSITIESKKTNMTKRFIEFNLAIGSIPRLANIDLRAPHSILMLSSV